jgi:signal transduction histidine kinase
MKLFNKTKSDNASSFPLSGVWGSLFILCIMMGLVCNYLYDTSPGHAIRTAHFQKQLNRKENQATKTLDDLEQIIIHSSVDSLIHYPFADNDISYYVFNEDDEPVFWSDNNLDISTVFLPDSTGWQYVQLLNAHCVSRILTVEDKKIMALIIVKNNYPYENEVLTNNFAHGFDMDKQVRIVNGKSTDKHAVFSSKGNYLFSLFTPQTPVYNGTWSFTGFIFYALAFLFFLLLYVRTPFLIKKESLSLKHFGILATSVGIFTGLCLYFNFPHLLFWNKLFTPYQYASTPLLASISHLSVTTGYFLATICLFYFHVNTGSLKTSTGRIFLQIIFVLYFVLIYCLQRGLIYHSSIQLSILHFNNISPINLWAHFLILLWGIGLALLFFKTHTRYKTNHLLKQAFYIDMILSVLIAVLCFFVSPGDTIRIYISFTALCLIFYLPFILSGYKNIYGFMACWIFIFSAFLVWNSSIINNHKKEKKYQILAQNISINGNTENDRMADILLEDMDVRIKNDPVIGRLVSDTDSISAANEYLNKTYLRGFWNKYDMRLNAAQIHSKPYNIYKQYITNEGTKIKNTHFYIVPANENDMSYIGEFQAKTHGTDSVFFYMEFYPRRNFQSYSFPNLLITSAPNIQTQLNIAISKYENNRLVYSSGNLEFPPNAGWIPKTHSDFFQVVNKGLTHYVYVPDKSTYIVISEQQLNESVSYLLYFAYIFLIYFSVCSLLVWIWLRAHRKESYRLGFTAKFQYTFITLLIISFLLIFYVSVNFIQKKYQEQQIANLENKKGYIQKALQDRYYWNQGLSYQNTQTLDFDLQELSYTYHTDIHVYDNQGVLVGSSQPLIFNNSLIGKRIAPAPFFTQNAGLNQYEHIGKLKYLSGYTDFYNGDYLQIGYISIPQFFSQEEIRNEIESFLAVIIHIYLIIIILAILLSIFIGRQLSAPLIMLENKLKEMRLGRRNEKIEYNLNDEIGQLVIQYNRTVDELEQSARLLAKSERESAWKSMARQVAHEINNPLTPMKLSIQQLQRTKKLNDERFDDYFEKSTVMLVEQIDNLSRIAGTFSDFARMPEANFKSVDIAARLVSVVQLFAGNNEQIELNYQGPEKDIYVYADQEQLVQVFNNLFKNAIQAIPYQRKGKIQVILQAVEEQVIIDVTDNGTGIADEAHDKLFAPNFTTKTTGMGLGLAIAKEIIELSGGTISFTTRPDEGTTFTIILQKAD